MPGFIIFGLSMLVTILFMLALRPMARSAGLIDKPGGRKNHVGEIPVVGGIAMLAGLAVGVAGITDATGYAAYLLVAMTLLVIIGALDDRFDLPASVRFLAQVCAALIMVAGARVVVRDLGDVFFSGLVELDLFAVPFTIVIVVTAINAFNMFDGSDGIAGVQAVISLLFMGFACLMAGSMSYVAIIASLIGCVLGFLLFNWPSKRTREMRSFMGDAGSTMLGFSLAWLSTDLSQGESRVMAPVVALWIFALPIFDLFGSMIRRLMNGHSPLRGDDDHLHHVLRRFGLSSRQVAQLILAISAVFAAIGITAHLLAVAEGAMFIAWLIGGIAYFVTFHSGLVVKRRRQPRGEDATPVRSWAVDVSGPVQDGSSAVEN